MININICADDYALTPGVSAGILELISAGRISGTSVMTTSEYWPETSSALIQYQGKVDVGIHLTLTDQQPLTPMPRFAPQGKFPPVATLIQQAYCKQLPLAEIRQELIEQLQRFYLYFGAWPSHIDGHHHVHILPGIREIVMELFGKFIGEDGYLRNCYATPLAVMRRRVGWRKALGISMLSWPLKRQLNKLTINTNASFAGVYDFMEDTDDFSIQQQYAVIAVKRYGEVFNRFLISAKDKLLIMVHPGYADAILRSKDPLVVSREDELRFLHSDQFLQILHTNSAVLKPFTIH